jgi:hypothetical protein
LLNSAPMRHAILLAVVLCACVGQMSGSGGGGGSSSGSGGGSGGGNGGGITSPDMPCAVVTVLQGTCQQCHGATLANAAPMHMVTRDDLLAPSIINPDQSVGQRCVLRMQAMTGEMPPAPQARIDDTLIAGFNDWVTRGMPAEACGGTGGGSGNGGGGASVPFTPDDPAVYVAKVKTVLVGLAPTDAEVSAVRADPSQLSTLVDEWQHLPQYQQKMQRFFQLAFQQTQITQTDFSDLTSNGQMVIANRSLLQNVQESFARTALAQNAANVPFNKLMDTKQYMMTTALQVFYAVLDVAQVDDNGTLHDAFRTANMGKNIVVSASSGPIPIEQSVDPTNTNYLHFYDPNIVAECGMDPYTQPARSNVLFEMLFGGRLNVNQYGCAGGPFTMQLLPGDFTDWHMVTVRKPQGAEKTTEFYDLPTLRASTQNTLILNRPYVGFFTTPAFFANWQTNSSNQARVTINQTFIAATGQQVDGTDTTTPTMTPGLDAAHANQASCNYCHQTLDPSRSIFSATYSWNYGSQLDTTWSSQKGLFAFRGVQAPITSIYDLGTTLSNHPLVAPGWVQKLCYWINSQACEESDPEYQRLVSLFQTSSFAWDPLVKALVTSPLTTHASATATATQDGAAVAVARRDHLCALWNARLGFTDVCGFDVTRTPVLPGAARLVIPGLPSDGYSRGATIPVLPNDPSLFYRAGLENLCAGLAALVIDNAAPPAGVRTWSSSQPTAAIADFVNVLAGLPPSDPRAAGLQQILTDHFNTAKATSGITVKAALESTFMAACMAPSASAIGL